MEDGKLYKFIASIYIFFFAFLVKKTSGILFFGQVLYLFFGLDDAFRAGLRKLGPKNNIPEVFLTKKHESRKSPILYYIYLYFHSSDHLQFVFSRRCHKTGGLCLEVGEDQVDVDEENHLLQKKMGAASHSGTYNNNNNNNVYFVYVYERSSNTFF